MIKGKIRKLWVPRTTMYLTYGTTDGEPIFDSLNLIGKDKYFSVSLTTEFGAYPLKLDWIITPKYSKDLGKSKGNLLKAIEKATHHGLVRNLTSQPSDGLVFDNSLISSKRAGRLIKPKKLPKKFELSYLADQVIPIIRAYYGINSNSLRTSELDYLKSSGEDSIKKLSPSLMDESQLDYANKIFNFALMANPEPINSRKLYDFCKRHEFEELFNGAHKSSTRYMTVKNLTSKINEYEKSRNLPERNVKEVHTALDYLVSKGCLYEIYERNNLQSSYRPNLRTNKRKSYKGLEKRNFSQKVVA